MRFLLVILAIMQTMTTITRADTINAGERTTTIAIASDNIGETREIFVRLPPAPLYSADRTYPVIYVLDGEWNFDLVAAHLDYMVDNGVYPPVIVTGIRNIDRNRDYLPMSDPNYANSGGGDQFLTLVESGWIDVVENAFPVSGKRILVGHSFGGVFTLHNFLKRPDLFDGYIAISASAWLGDQQLARDAVARFASGTPENRFVYFASGEFDGGPTRPTNETLGDVFAKNAPDELDWHYETLPASEHFRAFTLGLNNALAQLFPAPQMIASLKEASDKNDAQNVHNWFDANQKNLGYRFFPSWFDYGIIALTLSRDGAHQAALAVVERTQPYHKENPIFLSFAARVFEAAGDVKSAKSALASAVVKIEEYGLHPNAINIDEVKANLARLEASASAD